MDFLDSLDPQIKLLLQVLAFAVPIIGGIIALYQPIKDYISSINAKKVQPKLAISLANGSRMRGRANDIIYHPFDLSEDRVITFDQQKLLSFDWDLQWRFTMNITNQSPHTAYNIKLMPFPMEEQYVSIHLTPILDPTKAFLTNKTESFEVVCRLQYRCKPEEADEMIKKYPFRKLRLEYTNQEGFKFATAYSSDEKDNQFITIGKK